MKKLLYVFLLLLPIVAGFAASYEAGKDKGRGEVLEDLQEVEVEYTRVLGEYVALQTQYDTLLDLAVERGCLTKTRVTVR
jgi:hypothetical protein